MEAVNPDHEKQPLGPVEIGYAEPELYVSHRGLVGALAMWAIDLNPIFLPTSLEEALVRFYVATENKFKADPIFTEGHTPTIIFKNRSELRAYIEPILESIPVIMEWNKSKNERDGKVEFPKGGHTQFQIVTSSFADQQPSPENDFVDIGALANNIANYFHFEAERSRTFNEEFERDHPQPPAITEPYPIFMREDGDLPTEQRDETFMEWVERVAEQVPFHNELSNQQETKWISRVDGGFMGLATDNFAWLFVQGIRERIQMMDAEEGKTACIGFNPSEQKWYGWSRGCAGFGIGYVAQKGDTVTQSGSDAGYLKEHPEKDFRVPVGFEAKTLVDAKRLAIAFAESLS